MGNYSILVWLRAVVFDWAVIVASYLLLYLAWDSSIWICLIVWPVCNLLIGCRQHALAILGHDATHQLVSCNRVVNDLIGNWSTLYLLLFSINSYRKFHFDHHDNLGTDLDPELDARKAQSLLGSLWKLPQTKKRFWLEAALSLVGIRFYCYLFLVIGLFPRTITGLVYIVLLWTVVLGILWATGQWWILGVWFVSLATSFWMAFWLRTWTEHIGTAGTAGTHRIVGTWWQRFLFMPHNTYYHYEHHQHPGTPFYQLPLLRHRDTQLVTIGELFKSFEIRK